MNVFKLFVIAFAFAVLPINVQAQEITNDTLVSTQSGVTGMEEFLHTDACITLKSGKILLAHYKVYIGIKDNQATMLSYHIFADHDEIFDKVSNGCLVAENPETGYGDLLGNFRNVFLSLPDVVDAYVQLRR